MGQSNDHVLRKNDELLDIIKKELYTAVIGDIMDKLNLLHQFLPPQLRPIKENMFIVGRAMTVLEADIESTDIEQDSSLAKVSFGLMLDALDDLKAGEVYICTGASPTYALWGELMSTRAQMLGAAGAVVNGYSRDTKGIINLNFPTFSLGCYAKDQAKRGKVIDFRVPIKIGEVFIQSGDIIVGDIDGVCVIPQKAAQEIVHLALEKARGEKTVQKKIKEGLSAKRAFEIYGII